MKMLISNERLREKFSQDNDLECEAGAAHPEAPAAEIDRVARQHAVELDQCSLFVDSTPLAKAMTDSAEFLRKQFPA